LLQEIDRAGDVGVDDPAHLLEVLVDEGPAEAPPGIGEQRIDRPPARRRQQAVHTVGGGKIGLQSRDLPPGVPEQLGGAHDFRLVGHGQQVVAMGGALLGKLKADAGRGAGHDGKRGGGAVDVLGGRIGRFRCHGFSTTLMQLSFLSRNVL
jgi:hypothetical protein